MARWLKCPLIAFTTFFQQNNDWYWICTFEGKYWVSIEGNNNGFYFDPLSLLSQGQT